MTQRFLTRKHQGCLIEFSDAVKDCRNAARSVQSTGNLKECRNRAASTTQSGIYYQNSVTALYLGHMLRARSGERVPETAATFRRTSGGSRPKSFPHKTRQSRMKLVFPDPIGSLMMVEAGREIDDSRCAEE
jgi:hypothetical protein